MRNSSLLRALCGVLLFITCTGLSRAVAQSALLVDEGFEGGFQNDASGGGTCAQGGCDVPAGWGVWFTKRADTDPAGVNVQPKYEQARTAGRFRGGAAALRYASDNATHTGGVYRIVQNVTPGTRLVLSAYGMAWSTNDDSPISARPSRDVRLKIGIDPLGGDGGKANPFSPQIVWSAEQSPLDAFRPFSIEVEAKAATVVVYLYSTMKDPVRHNDVYWDDVRVGVAQPPATPTPAAAEATPDPAAAPTAVPTAAPSTDVTVTVESGDTLLGIAFDNGITLEELQKLNPGVQPETLQVGAVLIVKKGAPPPEPTSAPAPGDAPIAPSDVLSGTPTVGAACVQAYFDDDGNGERAERGEDLVPQILFTLSRDGATLGTYTSNGVDEPYCFENLDNGSYVVAATVLQIYQPSTPINDTLRVRGGRSFFSIGIRRIADAAVDVSATATPATAAPAVDGDNVIAVVAVAGGILMIIGLIGFVVSTALRRKRV
jgi:LysM repeat protein